MVLLPRCVAHFSKRTVEFIFWFLSEKWDFSQGRGCWAFSPNDIFGYVLTPGAPRGGIWIPWFSNVEMVDQRSRVNSNIWDPWNPDSASPGAGGEDIAKNSLGLNAQHPLPCEKSDKNQKINSTVRL